MDKYIDYETQTNSKQKNNKGRQILGKEDQPDYHDYHNRID